MGFQTLCSSSAVDTVVREKKGGQEGYRPKEAEEAEEERDETTEKRKVGFVEWLNRQSTRPSQ